MSTPAQADPRIARLLAAMTQAEKLALLHGPFAATHPRPPRALGSAGFVPGVPRLGIPDLQETDAGLGVTNPYDAHPGDTAVALPSGMAVAASFDPDAAYRNGAVLGREAAARGFNVVLGGGVNLVRDPRGGRQFEYAGEDPLLAGTMAGAAIRGIQAQHVVATVKHFVANDQETGRMVYSVDASWATLRESDLLAFEIAIEQGRPGAVMCAYNRVHGVYACDNPDLLTGILKQDWHFPGWVMSDWGAVHGTAAIAAGLDQESGEQFDAQPYFGKALTEAVATGTVPVARIDEAAGRILSAMAVSGLLDSEPPDAGPPSAKPPTAGVPNIGAPQTGLLKLGPVAPDGAADLAAARRTAAEGMVLLANRGLLPLPRTLHRLCVFGGNADAGVPAGGGSSQVTPLGGVAREIPLGGEVQPPSFNVQVYDPPSPLSRLRAKLPGARVLFDDGRYPAQAARLARSCEAAIVFAQDFAGEEHDLPGLSLPAGQDGLIQAVTAANPRTVVVLETAGAVLMPWLARAGAVLEAWYPGSGGADAIADILLGDVAPSGRLPVTFPAAEADLPNPALPGRDLPEGTPFSITYPEGSDAGYRWFARRAIRPAFPFGFGVSMTRFAYGGLRVSGGRALVVDFDVRNVGARPGTDVPQVYLTARGGLRLLGWKRLTLQPGESGHVTLAVDPRLLAYFSVARRRWVVPGGTIAVAVGANAGDLALTGRVVMAARDLPP